MQHPMSWFAANMLFGLLLRWFCFFSLYVKVIADVPRQTVDLVHGCPEGLRNKAAQRLVHSKGQALECARSIFSMLRPVSFELFYMHCEHPLAFSLNK